MLSVTEVGSKGVEELGFLVKMIEDIGLQSAQLAIDVKLARGLDYYTGAILEVTAPEHVQMGSIGGGGRYDDLTGIFGLQNVSGVGISFGLDRIYLVMEELGLFPTGIDRSLELLFLNFGEKEALTAIKMATKLRKSGVLCEVYPEAAKIQKQLKYADKRQVPYVILLGEKEMNEGTFVLKDMRTGQQEIKPQKEVGSLSIKS